MASLNFFFNLIISFEVVQSEQGEKFNKVFEFSPETYLILIMQ